MPQCPHLSGAGLWPVINEQEAKDSWPSSSTTAQHTSYLGYKEASYSDLHLGFTSGFYPLTLSSEGDCCLSSKAEHTDEPRERVLASLDTHQNGGQLSPAPHIHLDGQAVGQGSAEQQEESKAEGEVDHVEICRSREICLWPSAMDLKEKSPGIPWPTLSIPIG